MVKRKSGVLDLTIDEGSSLQLDLNRQRISDCRDLRAYLRSEFGRTVLKIKGRHLRVNSQTELLRRSSDNN